MTRSQERVRSEEASNQKSMREVSVRLRDSNQPNDRRHPTQLERRRATARLSAHGHGVFEVAAVWRGRSRLNRYWQSEGLIVPYVTTERYLSVFVMSSRLVSMEWTLPERRVPTRR